ncbi:hypothetical protein [Nonomuraea sp. NPDC049725]|uniref:hypothetical protein n=1 Tax=Nonomuraea sp. NPDC049725 TaxID=3154508 RepID=UPI003430D6C4
MKSSVLARKVAAFGASTFVLAGLVAGLVSSPAQAATASSATAGAAAAKTKAKVSVSTPKVSERDYVGACPVSVTFSATVKVSSKAKTTLAYRWLHGDGSKSKVKTVKVKGTKSVKVTEKVTFKGDVKGWQALQVLGPRTVTSKKSYFSVNCMKLEGTRDDVRVSARAWASPSHYVGSCDPGKRIHFAGRITVNRPAWVRYRWVVNGDVVDYGKVKVWDSRKVYAGITARHSQRGSAVLQILSPDREYSNRAYYKVWCKDYTPPAPAVKVSASDLVTATNHDGCKVSAHANINLNRAADVRWVWSVNGQAVEQGSRYFGSGTKNVSLSQRALHGAAKNGGKITLSVYGPNNSDSITQSYAACDEPKPEPSYEVSGASVTASENTCPSGTLSGSATVTGKNGFKGQAVWTYEGTHLGSANIGDGSTTVSFSQNFNELTKDGVAELKIFDPSGKLLKVVPASFQAPCKKA